MLFHYAKIFLDQNLLSDVSYTSCTKNKLQILEGAYLLSISLYYFTMESNLNCASVQKICQVLINR